MDNEVNLSDNNKTGKTLMQRVADAFHTEIEFAKAMGDVVNENFGRNEAVSLSLNASTQAFIKNPAADAWDSVY